MTFVLDTNHVMAHLNGHRGVAGRIAAHQATGDVFAITTTVLGVLYYGAYASQRSADNLADINADLVALRVN